MGSRPLIVAWAGLAVLSAATTLITLAPAGAGSRILAAGSLLLLAGLKARLILTHYLGLRGSRFWRGGFTLALAIFLLVAFALYLAGMGEAT